MRSSLIAVLLFSASFPPAQAKEVSKDTGQILDKPPAGVLVHRMPPSDFKPSAAYQWLQVILEAAGRDTARKNPRPTIISREMAIAATAMYDAWAAYDAAAVGTRLHDKLRRPPNERTRENKEKAIAYAAYRSLLFVYPDDAAWLRERLRKRGFDPDNASTDLATPEGIGNAAADAVADDRRHDGANQLGDEPGGDGTPYSDYTGYKPKNAPDHIADPDSWFPIPFSDGHGGTVSHGYLTPQWGLVRPFALERPEQFRPPPPPKFGSERHKMEVDETIKVNAELTLEQKTIVEMMREGPRSTGQSGHWLQFAMDVSLRDRNELDRDVKLFFSVSNVVMDAFIACWEAKRHYDTGRPYWWARLYHKGETIDGWLGPGKGAGQLKAEDWQPYSPDTFLTPPFPGYVSGHATASGAASRMLELFTGSDRYGAIAYQQAGELTEPEYSTALMQARDGKPAEGAPESKEVRLSFPTFTATAETAALSRLWGGYHIRSDNDEGLILGRRIASYSWPKYQAYFDGTAPAPADADSQVLSVPLPDAGRFTEELAATYKLLSDRRAPLWTTKVSGVDVNCGGLDLYDVYRAARAAKDSHVEVGPAMMGKKDFRLKLGRLRLQFESEKNRSSYVDLVNKGQALPAYGCWCAYGIAAPGNPHWAASNYPAVTLRGDPKSRSGLYFNWGRRYKNWSADPAACVKAGNQQTEKYLTTYDLRTQRAFDSVFDDVPNAKDAPPGEKCRAD